MSDMDPGSDPDSVPVKVGSRAGYFLEGSDPDAEKGFSRLFGSISVFYVLFFSKGESGSTPLGSATLVMNEFISEDLRQHF